MEKTLYIRDNAGKLRYWTCRESLDGLEIEHGVLNGTPQFQYESIEEGKAGRSQDEQIWSRINSRCNKQMDKGYVTDLEVAKVMKPVNSLGFNKPMLAKKSEDVDMHRMMTKPFYLQNKLDGNRCPVANDGTGLVAYTRNGKEFTTLKHILEPLKTVLPSDVTIDGELYLHGVSLQTIVSWGKRLQPDTLKLQLHIYDIMEDAPFSERNKELGAILTPSFLKAYPSIRRVETRAYTPDSGANLRDLLAIARGDNYEGLMFRSDYAMDRGVLKPVGYEDGKRSGSLIKLKYWEDQEFPIVDILPSADGWAVLQCRAPNGKFFTVSCPGDVTFKRYVLHHKADYIEKYEVTVQFAYWTADGLPFHCVATAIRDYE